MTKPRSRAQRWAPVWTLALRGRRLLRDERMAHRETRQRLAVANALAEHRRAELADAEARYKRLEANHDFLVSGRLAEMDQ